MSELARRAVACKAWRWMPGMTCQHGHRMDTDDESHPGDYVGCAPNLDDAATRGCLLALVREVSYPEFCVWHDSDMAQGWTFDDASSFTTEAEALVAALEAAP